MSLQEKARALGGIAVKERKRRQAGRTPNASANMFPGMPALSEDWRCRVSAASVAILALSHCFWPQTGHWGTVGNICTTSAEEALAVR